MLEFRRTSTRRPSNGELIDENRPCTRMWLVWALTGLIMRRERSDPEISREPSTFP
jgi:hypothetical protein